MCPGPEEDTGRSWPPAQDLRSSGRHRSWRGRHPAWGPVSGARVLRGWGGRVRSAGKRRGWRASAFLGALPCLRGETEAPSGTALDQGCEGQGSRRLAELGLVPQASSSRVPEGLITSTLQTSSEAAREPRPDKPNQPEPAPRMRPGSRPRVRPRPRQGRALPESRAGTLACACARRRFLGTRAPRSRGGR